MDTSVNGPVGPEAGHLETIAPAGLEQSFQDIVPFCPENADPDMEKFRPHPTGTDWRSTSNPCRS